jgi:hypothetical protein
MLTKEVAVAGMSNKTAWRESQYIHRLPASGSGIQASPEITHPPELPHTHTQTHTQFTSCFSSSSGIATTSLNRFS